MDTSNIASVNNTHDVAYAWEIQHSGSTNINEGNDVASITLRHTKPIATRVGPLLTGGSTIALDLVAILRVDDYIYIYSSGGLTNMYVSNTPFGPWGKEYGLLKGWGPDYGSMAHPEYSTDGQ